jgi:hypothetical protein
MDPDLDCPRKVPLTYTSIPVIHYDILMPITPAKTRMSQERKAAMNDLHAEVRLRWRSAIVAPAVGEDGPEVQILG